MTGVRQVGDDHNLAFLSHKKTDTADAQHTQRIYCIAFANTEYKYVSGH